MGAEPEEFVAWPEKARFVGALWQTKRVNGCRILAAIAVEYASIVL